MNLIRYCAIVYENNRNQNSEIEDVNVSGFIDQDPFDGLGVHSEERFKKLDKVVFADPIKYTPSPNYDDNSEQKLMFLDKVTVEKRVGKRNKYHIEIEDISNPVCPEKNCNKKFSTITLLKAHIRKVHCYVQCCMCEICGLGFKEQFLLNRHMAVHESGKMECPLCKKLLSKRTNLSVHMQFVHRQGELKCDKCNQRFTKRSQYTRHKSTHRNGR